MTFVREEPGSQAVSPRARALAGLTVLFAVAAVVVGSRLVAAHWVDGVPQADWSAPPSVGSCVNVGGGSGDEPAGSDAESGVGDGVVTVPCEGPHDAEVTQVFTAKDPELADSPTATMDAACYSAALGYLGFQTVDTAGAAGSAGGAASGGGAGPSTLTSDAALIPVGTPPPTATPGLSFMASRLGAMPAQRTAGLGWEACVIMPAPELRYIGAVAGAESGSAPDAYRSCQDAASTTISCAVPHAAEVLAQIPAHSEAVRSELLASLLAAAGPAARSARGGVPSGDDAAHSADVPVLNREGILALSRAVGAIGTEFADGSSAACLAAAREALGVADPTYGGAVTVRARPVTGSGVATWQLMVGAGRDAAAGMYADGAMFISTSSAIAIEGGESAPSTGVLMAEAQNCVVEVTNGKLLERSIVDWGARDLPLSGG